MKTHSDVAAATVISEKITLTKSLLFILTVGAGLSVANIYYNQPMLGILAEEFHQSPAIISLIPFLSQAGYALGILFLSPLGDRFERKKLILATMTLLIIAIAATAISTSIEWLAITSLITGILATVTQQIVPLSVNLAAPSERGKVIGIVTGGILLGILLARTVGGYVTDQMGWRSMYWIAAALMSITSLAMAIKLPKVLPTTNISYLKVMKSLGTLFIKYPALRQAAFIQSLIFGAFLAFWSTLAQLFQQPSYNLGATAVGLIGVIGAGGALIAPIAGKLSDARGPKLVITLGAGLLAIAFGILGGIQNSLTALIIAVIIMDLAVQASQVSNQAQVYALDPTARSRLNTVFMTAMFCGGAAGSALGSIAFGFFNWTGTCAIAGIAALLALLISFRTPKTKI